MAPTTRRESAGEIAKRYGLADLVKTRMLARRLYLNTLARRASISYQDSLDLLDPDLSPYEVSLLHPGKFYLMNDPVTSRRNLPPMETRYMYNRRMAELEAERLAAEERADRMVTRYLTRAKARRATTGTGDDKDNNEKDNEDDEKNEDDDNNNNNEHDKEEDDEELLDDDLYLDGYDPLYYGDPHIHPYDLPTWRHAKRLYRRRLYPYRFRPLGMTTRLMERRLKGL